MECILKMLCSLNCIYGIFKEVSLTMSLVITKHSLRSKIYHRNKLQNHVLAVSRRNINVSSSKLLYVMYYLTIFVIV